MRTDERSNSEFGYFLAGTLPIAIAVALIPFRESLTTATMALTFVIGVVLVAGAGGRGPGAWAAITSVLSFDFFLTRPYLSMRINSSDDIEAAMLLLIVGLIVGTLSTRAGRARANVDNLRREVRRIHVLAEMVAAGTPAADVIMAAQVHLAELLRLTECRFEAPPFSHSMPRLERSGGVEDVHEHHLLRSGFELPRGEIELPVLVSGHPVGRFVLVGTAGVAVSLERRVVAIALVDQVAAAINERRLPRA